MKKGTLKKILKIGIVVAVLSSILPYYVIEISVKNKVYDDVQLIEYNRVGLVLGTSKLLSNGEINAYFQYRVTATEALHKSGKIKYILVSGDNSNKDYEEPTDFKNALIKRGIPSNKIYLDYAGFRTLDSVIRANKIFGLHTITIISQEFHNERAVFLAELHGINAVGFNAKTVSKKYGIKVYLREYLARTKVFVDILFRVKPKFLGNPIQIK
ncbi:SanA/YdcF family protein [Wenyingzhuangia sp. IMCC45533]